MLFVLQQLRVQRPKSYLCVVLGLAEGTTERANMVGRKACQLWAIRESSQVKGIRLGSVGHVGAHQSGEKEKGIQVGNGL